MKSLTHISGDNGLGASAPTNKWSSPTPYLLASVALTVGLIALALTILACSYRKSSYSVRSNPSSDDTGDKSVKPACSLEPEMEPKIVVIMPGYDVPSYLATPVIPKGHRTEEV